MSRWIPDSSRRGDGHIDVYDCTLAGVLLFVPEPRRGEHGLFVHTFDAKVAEERGIDPTIFRQHTQSRTRHGVLRALQICRSPGERKLVRCSHGAVHDVLVDARPTSPTFGAHEAFRLDDVRHVQLYIPAGILHGFQALTGTADVCFQVDRAHDRSEQTTVRHDDPELAIGWPLAVNDVAPNDGGALSWADLRARLRAHDDSSYTGGEWHSR